MTFTFSRTTANDRVLLTTSNGHSRMILVSEIAHWRAMFIADGMSEV